MFRERSRSPPRGGEDLNGSLVTAEDTSTNHPLVPATKQPFGPQPAAPLLRDVRKNNQTFANGDLAKTLSKHGIRLVDTVKPGKSLNNKRPILGWVTARTGLSSYTVELDRWLQAISPLSTDVSSEYEGRWLSTRLRLPSGLKDVTVFYSLKNCSSRTVTYHGWPADLVQEAGELVGRLLALPDMSIKDKATLREMRLEAGRLEMIRRTSAHLQQFGHTPTLVQVANRRCETVLSIDQDWHLPKSSDSEAAKLDTEFDLAQMRQGRGFLLDSGVEISSQEDEDSMSDVLLVDDLDETPLGVAGGISFSPSKNVSAGHLGVRDDNTVAAQYFSIADDEDNNNDNEKSGNKNEDNEFLLQEIARLKSKLELGQSGTRKKVLPIVRAGLEDGSVVSSASVNSGFFSPKRPLGFRRSTAEYPVRKNVLSGDLDIAPTKLGMMDNETAPNKSSSSVDEDSIGLDNLNNNATTSQLNIADNPEFLKLRSEVAAVRARAGLLEPFTRQDGKDLSHTEFPRYLRTIASQMGVPDDRLKKLVVKHELQSLKQLKKFARDVPAGHLLNKAAVIVDDRLVQKFPTFNKSARFWQQERRKIITFALEYFDTQGREDPERTLCGLHEVWLRKIESEVGKDIIRNLRATTEDDDEFFKRLEKHVVSTWNINFVKANYGRKKIMYPLLSDRVQEAFDMSVEDFMTDQDSVQESSSGEFQVMRAQVGEFLDIVVSEPPRLGDAESSYRDVRRNVLSMLELRLSMGAAISDQPFGSNVGKILEVGFIAAYGQLKTEVWRVYPSIVKPFKAFPLKRELGVWHALLHAIFGPLKDSHFLLFHNANYTCPIDVDGFRVVDYNCAQAADELESLRTDFADILNKVNDSNPDLEEIKGEIKKELKSLLGGKASSEKVEELKKKLDNLAKRSRQDRSRNRPPQSSHSSQSGNDSHSDNNLPAKMLSLKDASGRPIILGDVAKGVPEHPFRQADKNSNKYRNRTRDAADGTRYKYLYEKLDNEWKEIAGPAFDGEYLCVLHACGGLCPIPGKLCRCPHANFDEKTREKLHNEIRKAGLVDKLASARKKYISEIVTNADKKETWKQFEGFTEEQMLAVVRGAVPPVKKFDATEKHDDHLRHLKLKLRLPLKKSTTDKEVETVRQLVNQLPKLLELLGEAPSGTNNMFSSLRNMNNAFASATSRPWHYSMSPSSLSDVCMSPTRKPISSFWPSDELPPGFNNFDSSFSDLSRDLSRMNSEPASAMSISDNSEHVDSAMSLSDWGSSQNGDCSECSIRSVCKSVSKSAPCSPSSHGTLDEYSHSQISEPVDSPVESTNLDSEESNNSITSHTSEPDSVSLSAQSFLEGSVCLSTRATTVTDFCKAAEVWVEQQKEKEFKGYPDLVDLGAYLHEMRDVYVKASNETLPVFECTGDFLATLKKKGKRFRVNIPPRSKLRLISGEEDPTTAIGSVSLKLGTKWLMCTRSGKFWYLDDNVTNLVSQDAQFYVIRYNYVDPELGQIQQLDFNHDTIPTLQNLQDLKLFNATSNIVTEELTSIDFILKTPWLSSLADMRVGDVAVIHGPFGTGKSRNLCAAARLFEKKHSEQNIAVGLGSGCNAQVVSLASRVLKDVGSTDSILWVPSKIFLKKFDKTSPLNACSLDGKILQAAEGKFGDNFVEMAKEYLSLERELEAYTGGRGEGTHIKAGYPLNKEERRDDLYREFRNTFITMSQHRFIFGTLCSLALVSSIRPFAMVCLDELAQTHDLRLCLGLQRSARAVLAGCHLQLLPNLHSLVNLQPRLRELERSFMHRAAAQHGEFEMMLKEQFRCVENIVRLPVSAVYGNSMTTASGAPTEANYLMEPSFVFVDASMDNERTPFTSKSTADVGFSLYSRLRDLGLQVFIVTVHVPQVELYRSMGVQHVNNLDKIQGLEEEVVILDLTTHHVELSKRTRGWRSANVAMTRGKTATIFVGNAGTTLAADSMYSWAFAICQLEDSYFSTVDSFFDSLKVFERNSLANDFRAIKYSKFDASLQTLSLRDHPNILDDKLVLLADRFLFPKTGAVVLKKDIIADIQAAVADDQTVYVQRWASSTEASKAWTDVLDTAVPLLHGRGIEIILFDDTVERIQLPEITTDFKQEAEAVDRQLQGSYRCIRPTHQFYLQRHDSMLASLPLETTEYPIFGTGLKHDEFPCGLPEHRPVSLSKIDPEIDMTPDGVTWFSAAAREFALSDGARFEDSSRLYVAGEVRIFVGGIHSRKGREWTTVVNCTRNIELFDETDIRCPINFKNPIDCLVAIQSLFRGFSENFPRSGDVLLHCYVGRDRSALVAYCLGKFLAGMDFRGGLKTLRPELRDHAWYIFEEWAKLVDRHGWNVLTIPIGEMEEIRAINCRAIPLLEVKNGLRIVSWNIGASGLKKFLKTRSSELLSLLEELRPHIIFWQELRCNINLLSSLMATLYEMTHYKSYFNAPHTLTGVSIHPDVRDSFEVNFEDAFEEGRVTSCIHKKTGHRLNGCYTPNSGTSDKDAKRHAHDEQLVKHFGNSAFYDSLIGDLNTMVPFDARSYLKDMPGNKDWERSALERIITACNGIDCGPLGEDTFVSWSYPRWSQRLDYFIINKSLECSNVGVWKQGYAQSTRLGPYDHAPIYITIGLDCESQENDGKDLATKKVVTFEEILPSDNKEEDLMIEEVVTPEEIPYDDTLNQVIANLKHNLAPLATFRSFRVESPSFTSRFSTCAGRTLPQSREETFILNGVTFSVSPEPGGKEYCLTSDTTPEPELVKDAEFIINGETGWNNKVYSKFHSLRDEVKAGFEAEDEAWHKYIKLLESKAVNFNERLALLKKSRIPAILEESVRESEKREDTDHIHALMYDDATSGAENGMDCALQLRKTTDATVKCGMELGVDKQSVGCRRVIIIGRAAFSGTLCITMERLENLINGPVVPYYASELLTRLCSINWAEEIVGDLNGLIHKILGPIARIEDDDAYREAIRTDERAITVCRAIHAFASINPLHAPPLGDIARGDILVLILIDSNVVFTAHLVIGIPNAVWMSDDDVPLRKCTKLYACKSRGFKDGDEEKEAGEAETEGGLVYFKETDPTFEHVRRSICFDARNSVVLRKDYHNCSNKKQMNRVLTLTRCLAKEGVCVLDVPREALTLPDSVGRDDCRYLQRHFAKTSTQEKFLSPNKVIRELLPQQRTVPEFDYNAWQAARENAPKPPKKRKRGGQRTRNETGAEIADGVDDSNFCLGQVAVPDISVPEIQPVTLESVGATNFTMITDFSKFSTFEIPESMQPHVRRLGGTEVPRIDFGVKFYLAETAVIRVVTPVPGQSVYQTYWRTYTGLGEFVEGDVYAAKTLGIKVAKSELAAEELRQLVAAVKKLTLLAEVVFTSEKWDSGLRIRRERILKIDSIEVLSSRILVRIPEGKQLQDFYKIPEYAALPSPSSVLEWYTIQTNSMGKDNYDKALRAVCVTDERPAILKVLQATNYCGFNDYGLECLPVESSHNTITRAGDATIDGDEIRLGRSKKTPPVKKVDPTTLPSVPTDMYEQLLKDAYLYVAGYGSIPKPLVYALTDDFILYIHQGCSCARVNVLKQAWFCGGYVEARDEQTALVVAGCERCHGDLDRQEPGHFHAIDIDSPGTAETDRFWIIPGVGHSVRGRVIQEESFEVWYEKSRKRELHYESTGKFLDDARPYRMVTNSMHQTSVERTYGEDAVDFQTHICKYEMNHLAKSNVKLDCVRGTDSEARGVAQATMITITNVSVDVVPAYAPNRGTPRIGSKQYLFTTQYYDNDTFAKENQLSERQREILTEYQVNGLFRSRVNFDHLTGADSEMEMWRKRAILGVAEINIVSDLARRNIRALARRRKFTNYSSYRQPCVGSTPEKPSAERVLMSHESGDLNAMVGSYVMGSWITLAGNQPYIRGRAAIGWKQQKPSNYCWSYLDAVPLPTAQAVRECYGIWKSYCWTCPFDDSWDWRIDLDKKCRQELLGGDVLDLSMHRPTAAFKVNPGRKDVGSGRAPTRILAIDVSSCVPWEIERSQIDGMLTLGCDGTPLHYAGKSLGTYKVALPGVEVSERRVILWVHPDYDERGQRFTKTYYLWVSVDGLPPIEQGLYESGTHSPSSRFRSALADTLGEVTDARESQKDKLARHTVAPDLHSIFQRSNARRTLHLFKQMLDTVSFFHKSGRHLSLVSRFTLYDNGVGWETEGGLVKTGLSLGAIAKWESHVGCDDSKRIACGEFLSGELDVDLQALGEVQAKLCVQNPVVLQTAVNMMLDQDLLATSNNNTVSTVWDARFGLLADSFTGISTKRDETSTTELLAGLVSPTAASMPGKNHSLRNSNISHERIPIEAIDHPWLSQDYVRGQSQKLHFVGENLTKELPTFSYGTQMAFLCAPPVRYSPPEGENLEDFLRELSTYREEHKMSEPPHNMDVVEELCDSGCEAGPLAKRVREILSLDFPRLMCFMHSCESLDCGKRELEYGWPLVDFPNQDESHVCRGFTGSATDGKPQVVYSQKAVLDANTGKVFRMAPRLEYLMPSFGVGDTIKSTIGNLDLCVAGYQMSTTCTHDFNVPVGLEGKDSKQIHTAKFIPKNVKSLVTGSYSKLCAPTTTSSEKQVVYETIRADEVREVIVPLHFPAGTWLILFLDKYHATKFTLRRARGGLCGKYPEPVCVQVDNTHQVTCGISPVGSVDRRIKIAESGGIYVPILAQVLNYGQPGRAVMNVSEVGGTLGIEDFTTDVDLEPAVSELRQKLDSHSVAPGTSVSTVPTAGFNRVLPTATQDLLEKAIEEDEKWWRKKRGVRYDSPAWGLAICKRICSTWDVPSLDRDALILSNFMDCAVTKEEIATLLEVQLSLLNFAAWGDESREHTFIPGYEMGVETLDFSKSPYKTGQLLPLSAAEAKMQQLLANREVKTGKWREYNAGEDGLVLLGGPGKRAPRGSTHLGRAYLNPPVNGMTVDIQCLTTNPEHILKFVQGESVHQYVSGDYIRAFAKVKVSKVLSRWLGIYFGGKTYLTNGGLIGHSVLPAVYSLLVYPTMNDVKSSPKEALRLASRILVEIRSGNVMSPLDGLLLRGGRL